MKKQLDMKKQSVEFSLSSIRWLATVTGLMAATGLLLLFSQDVWAAEPPAGANKPFSNPFAAPGGGSQDFFDDEMDEEDFPMDAPPPPPRPGSAGNTGASGNSGSGRLTAPTGVSAGGRNEVIATQDPPKPLEIDSETGDGAKEMVTDFNFPDADIMDIAKTLGKLTGKNFIMDKDVKGRITIISNGAITVGDAWRAFLTSLDINGFALIPSGKFIRIARQRDARDKQLRTFTGDYSPNTDALITRLFPLRYLSAEEVARNFRSFMPANSRIIPYEQTNTVIVTDTGSNISKLQKLLEILDVEGYDAGIDVIPVKFASAQELSKLIDALIPGTNVNAPGGAPRFSGSGSRFNARRTKEGGIINNIVPDDRTNALIIHANQKGVDQVRELIAKLDKKLPTSQVGGKVHVMYLQFAAAKQISDTLNNISQGSGVKVASGGAGTGSNPVAQSLFEGAIKISPDEATNSLVITASPSDYSTIQRVVLQLDIPRDQVYAEVVVMEVNLGRNFNFSSNVISPSSGLGFTTNDDLLNFIQSPVGGTGLVFGFKAGQTQEVSVGGQKFNVSGVQGLIKAIQTRSKANILATPQILALDNTEATFESTEKIPVPTSTISNGITTASITKEDVSLSITIKPQINKMANFVKMVVKTKFSDIVDRALPAAVRDAALATLVRVANTEVVVGDKDTVVLGGLIRDKSSETVNKIPILGDIPLLGWLFKSKKTQSEKSNLLIFITPHIVRQYETIRKILDKKLKERDDFLENHNGGEDEFKDTRDKMIRSLPDINELSRRRDNTTVTIDSPSDTPATTTGNEPARLSTPNMAPALPAPGGNAAPLLQQQSPMDPNGMAAPPPAGLPPPAEFPAPLPDSSGGN